MKMNILKLWPVPCLIFFIYCLYTLFVDSYEVIYARKNETDPLQFLTCKELSELYPNQKEIDLKELRGDLYNYLNSSVDNNWRKGDQIKFEELIRNVTKSDGYLVLNRRICLIAKDLWKLLDIWNFLSFRRVFFAIKIDTFDFVRLPFPLNHVEQLTVRKENSSDCDKNNGRFHCLNECFKRTFRLARYFYRANETGRILLDDSESNRTIQKNERICFGQCKRENCKLVQLIITGFLDESKIPKTFESQLVLSAFDFWVEIVGLIFSFVGLFFDKSASAVTKFTRSRVKQRKVKVGLFYFNLAIILLSLAYCGYLCVRVALDYQVEANDLQEMEITRNLIQPKTVHLVICLSFSSFFKYMTARDYKGKTMSQIEMETDRILDDELEGIYVSDGSRSFRTDYQVHHHKILFKTSITMTRTFLARCFLLTIQPIYQTIPSRPKLTVRFKKDTFAYELYLLAEEENFNIKSFNYYFYAFQKRIVKRSRSNGKCVNYEEKYGNCTGRQNCVERCISRKFLKKYNRTSLVTLYYHSLYYHSLSSPLIDRDWFSSSEWNNSQMMEMKEISDEDESMYMNVVRECEEEEIPDEKPCDETRFEKVSEIQQPDELTREIDLQFDVVQLVEELPSSLRMALDLLSIQSIFFGFTLLQLFWLLYQFIEPKWRLRNDKFIWFLVCLLASIGCTLNTVRMLDVIVNGKLVSTEHYEPTEGVQMPAVVFCLRIDQKLVDRNHQLTGNHLEELTEEMNAKRTFGSITYLNESNEWSSFDFRQIERFFLLDMKCFRIDIDQAYNRNQFHFSADTQVLRVMFNEKKENRLVHFMTQSRETAEFSKIFNLDYSDGSRYSVTHEPSLYEYEDRFGFFRRYYPPLQEGDFRDLDGQLLDLQDKEPNRRTLSLPVEEKHFGLQVDEEHFEQLYLAQMQKNRKKNLNKRTNLNYRQMFVVNYLNIYRGFESNFNFNLVFLRRVVHFKNEVNYATLTLGLLNLLSVWLELGVLDMFPFLVRLHDHLLVPLYLQLPVHFLRKLIKALLFCYRRLKKLKPILYELIDFQRKEENSPHC